MNREIKFRAWDKEDESMHDVLGISFYHRTVSVDTGGGKFLQDDEDRFAIMQSTGLYDKSNSPIYEGDILSTDLSRPYLVVEFRNGAFMFQCHDNGKDYYDFMTTVNEDSNFTKYHEVVGNIHQHSHLLGGVEE